MCGKSISLTKDWQLIVDALIGSHTVKLWNSHWGRPVVVPGAQPASHHSECFADV
jgi:hypothetical protein